MATVLQDNFTDTNNTSLDAHTMDVGGGWTEHSGTWEILSNHCEKRATTDTHQTASADAGVADVTVQAVLRPTAGGRYPGLCGRLTDNSNFWGVELDPDANTAAIYDRNAGTFTQRASGAVTIDLDTTYTVQLIFSGTTVTVKVDGVQICSYGSATFQQSATRFGLWGVQIAEQWDSFIVTTADAGGDAVPQVWGQYRRRHAG